MKPKILVVEDEETIRRLVRAYLEAEGYEVMQAADGLAGLKAVRVFKPDLVVLDIMLPGMDGIELLTTLRRETNVYVIMLTARTEETDKIVGLTVGADDYVTKPFSPRELVARVKSALRRMHTYDTEKDHAVYTFQHIRLDAGSRRVWVDDQEVELTTVEFNLLKVLAEYHGMVLSREQLLDKVWGYEYTADQRLVNVHIGNLRRKLGRDSSIVTVRGAGYRFEDRG